LILSLCFAEFSKRSSSQKTLLGCFDAVFQGPNRHFSIVFKVFFSLSDRYEIFTSNWRWIEICENVVLSKIDNYYDNNKQTKWKLITAEFRAS